MESFDIGELRATGLNVQKDVQKAKFWQTGWRQRHRFGRGSLEYYGSRNLQEGTFNSKERKAMKESVRAFWP